VQRLHRRGSGSGGKQEVGGGVTGGQISHVSFRTLTAEVGAGGKGVK